MIEQCVILCGGRGTRLGALTADVPKPLLPVGGRPFLEFLLTEMARQGARRILLLAGFAAQRIIDYVAESDLASRMKIDLEIVIEQVPSGTGGALWNARERLDHEFYLVNGDSWFDINLHSLEQVLMKAPDTVGTLALRPVENAGRFGTVTLDGDQLIDFAEHAQSGGPALINGGVYALRRTVVDYLNSNSSIERDAFPRLAREGRLTGLVFDSYFIDIGIPKDLARARQEIPARMSARADGRPSTITSPAGAD